jgi:poly-gamma-glutamate synthesis protein (capsule biosynthesis protein)
MKILIAGDFCPRYRVAEKFEHDSYESVLGDVKGIISEADYSIVNFECPVTKGGEKPIEKCGPNLQSSEKGMEAVKWAGFDCVTLANNHFLDFGKEGVEHTIEACDRYGIDTVGGGMDLYDASKILYKEIEGKTLAVINCCEHEFTIATEGTAGSNPLNPIQQYYAIIEARTKADYVLVIVHGGHEHYQLPSPRMQETYRFFVDAGADAVVNHHQHCYSGYEEYNGKPIFYGLGNFCFDWEGKRNQIWNYSLLLVLNFEEIISFELIPVIQCNEEPKVVPLLTKEAEEVMREISSLNNVITDAEKLRSSYSEFVKTRFTDIRIAFSPYSNRFLKALCNRRLIPSFISKKKKLLLYNYIKCQSHCDVITEYLTEALSE